MLRVVEQWSSEGRHEPLESVTSFLVESVRPCLELLVLAESLADLVYVGPDCGRAFPDDAPDLLIGQVFDESHARGRLQKRW